MTLGWDWKLETCPASPRVVRQGLPRTNVLVVNGEQNRYRGTKALKCWPPSLTTLTGTLRRLMRCANAIQPDLPDLIVPLLPRQR
ncbi:DUF4902 domain-containing protein [Variovorax rhizosphaerae]|uniref:DUF4902 domain-containing protein n=1 Tax=Variovorax rhizosphaerae TaxID=1836200 RepID=UPI003BF502D1